LKHKGESQISHSPNLSGRSAIKGNRRGGEFDLPLDLTAPSLGHGVIFVIRVTCLLYLVRLEICFGYGHFTLDSGQPLTCDPWPLARSLNALGTDVFNSNLILFFCSFWLVVY